MARLLLETKLHVPRRRRGLVARPTLTDRLSGGAGATLTLVSAPAGFGKTTLLAEWVAAAQEDGRHVAWVSLDRRDNDVATFWTYVAAAVNTAGGLGEAALAALDSPQPRVEEALHSLLNDLSASPDDVVMVLDDYHLIESREVHEGVAFLVEHLPPQLQLVIAGRADPALPLPRLRARGELVEIRAAELRFSPDEAAEYLNVVMGLSLTGADIAALEGRTEGWIAALQLAALSMQGRDDVAGFIAGFAGDDRFIVDYLAEEVMSRQSDEVRVFLLQTSILERLSGPLCDAVTGQDDGKATLAALERGNLFLVPLDDRRQWYRYHQLFADVLQAHLRDERPDEIATLHLRASEWFERNGELSEAIRHSLAARDFERSADLVEVAIPAMGRGRQEAELRTWLETLPHELVRDRPVLSIGLVGALLATTEQFGDSPDRLETAEKWLDITSEKVDSISESAEVRHIPGRIEVYRAAIALARGDGPGAVAHSHRALDLLPEDDYLGRSASAGFVGLTSWAAGDLENAHRAWSECVVGLRHIGHVADVLGCSIALADIRIAQGRLSDALLTCERGLLLAEKQEGVTPRGTADMHVAMSGIHLQRDEMAAAESDLARSVALGELGGLAQNRYRERVAMAHVRRVRGDLDGAIALLDEAERDYVGDYFPNVKPVPAVRARVLIAQGRLGDVRDWVKESSLSAEDELSYMREYEHITVARYLLAVGSVEEAAGLLERLLRAAEAGDRVDSVIEILVLQAVLGHSRGDTSAALACLLRALELAEPEGYVRVFVDEGPPIGSLLKVASKRGVAPDHTRRLLSAFGGDQANAPRQHSLVEPLSERELEVLRLLATDLDGPDLSRHLFISLNTLRTHTKNIYAKLGVNSRRAAVHRAEELGLIAR